MRDHIHRVTNVTDIIKDQELRKRADGIAYSLPLTKLLVTVDVRRIRTKPSALKGDTAREFAKQLGLKGLQEADEIKYVVTDTDTSFHAIHEPDPSQVYLVDAEQDSKDIDLLLKLSELGLITDAKAQVERKSLLMAILKGVMAVSAKLLPIVLSAAELDAAGDDEDTKTAKAYFERILCLRERREKLVSGEQPSIGLPLETLNRMLKELDSLEAKLLAAFTGAKTIEKWKAQFILSPESIPNGHWTKGLLALHPDKLEILAEDELINPPPVAWTAPHRLGLPLKGTKTRQVTIALLPDSEQVASQIALLPKLTGDQRIDSSSDGRSFHYRVPAMTDARLIEASMISGGKTAKRTLVADRLAVAQFGRVFSLPRFEIDKSGKYELKWHESTGSLESVFLKRVSGGEAQVQQIAAAAGPLIDVMDEKKLLQREVDLLELRVKQRQHEAALLRDELVAQVLVADEDDDVPGA